MVRNQFKVPYLNEACNSTAVRDPLVLGAWLSMRRRLDLGHLCALRKVVLSQVNAMVIELDATLHRKP